MEAIIDSFERLWNMLGHHVPFFLYVLFFAFSGQIAKRFVWTEKRIARLAAKRDVWWNDGGAKKVPAVLLKIFLAIPIPVHPVAVAFFIGLFPKIWISSGLENTFWVRELYVIGAAMVSMAVYDLLHAILRKHGLDFKLPGEASLTPPAPTPKPEDEERGGPGMPTTRSQRSSESRSFHCSSSLCSSVGCSSAGDASQSPTTSIPASTLVPGWLRLTKRKPNSFASSR